MGIANYTVAERGRIPSFFRDIYNNNRETI